MKSIFFFFSRAKSLLWIEKGGVLEKEEEKEDLKFHFMNQYLAFWGKIRLALPPLSLSLSLIYG